MKFWFENLGVLDQAELELKDLTVICGKNNTGKTYLTYALYGFLKYGKDFLDVKLSDNELKKLREEGSLEIDLYEKYLNNFNHILKKVTERYVSALDEFLGTKEERFKNTKIKIEIPLSYDLFSAAYKINYSTISGKNNKNIFSFLKPENSSQLSITVLIENEQSEESFFSADFIKNTIKDIIWKIIFPNPFIISSERTGAVTFRSELYFAKTRLIDLANKIKKDGHLTVGKVLDTIKAVYYDTDYPRPVTDNVTFINYLDTIENKTSFILKEHSDIIEDFENIIGGKYKISKEGNIGFITKKNNQHLTMNESSSAVRSLVMLGHYLKHIAKAGDILIIDEPELNLHPENQCKMARLIARLVNIGIKVFVTTHSDYFVKELNTLIMLNNDTEATRILKDKYKYHKLDSISIDKVNLYIAENGLALREGGKKRTRLNMLKKADIDPIYGIEAQTFDETINHMNKVQSELLDSLL